MTKEYVIIVAGGTGTRMKTKTPKQFLEINKVPVIVLCIKKFLKYKKDISIIIAVHPAFKKELRAICQNYFPKQRIDVVYGGETRYHSVKNALQIIPKEDGVVGIHDAARPFVSVEVIRKCFSVAAKKGNAIPAITLFESIRKTSNKKNKAVDRNQFKIIQTPQCFNIRLIKKAFEKKYSKKFTDDATVLENIGEKINLVEGNYENIKITNPNDMIIAKAYVSHDK
jgi:2-C-methyl-D-erythritol 4-phosphate cytidylyltransferase